jgi:hypothetical protein
MVQCPKWSEFFNSTHLTLPLLKRAFDAPAESKTPAKALGVALVQKTEGFSMESGARCLIERRRVV